MSYLESGINNMKSFVQCIYELQLNPNKNLWLFDLCLCLLAVTVFSRSKSTVLGDLYQLYYRYDVEQKIKASVESGWLSFYHVVVSKPFETFHFLINKGTIATRNLIVYDRYSLHLLVTKYKKQWTSVRSFFKEKYDIQKETGDLSKMNCDMSALVGLASQYFDEVRSRFLQMYPSLNDSANGWTSFSEKMVACRNKVQEVLSTLFVLSPSDIESIDLASICQRDVMYERCENVVSSDIGTLPMTTQ